MKVKMMPTVRSCELDEAIKMQYDLDLYTPDVLFCEDDFQHDHYLEYDYHNTDEDEFCTKKEMCVRQYLRDVFPQYNSILIKICL